jgi:hypothetical protein
MLNRQLRKKLFNPNVASVLMNQSPDEKTDTEESEASPRKRCGRPAIGVVVILFLYVLSIGPTISMSDHGAFSNRTAQLLGKFYFPLEYACEHLPFADKVLETYIELWRPDTLVTTPQYGFPSGGNN